MRIIQIHPVTPEKRFIAEIARELHHDAVFIHPTDSGYAISCSVHSKKGLNRLYQLKKPSKKYNMALIFQDFSAITDFAHVDNRAFKYMKQYVPGPYTFILPATNLGRKLLEVKRAEMGVRFPDHSFLAALHAECPDPIITTSASQNEDEYIQEAEEIAKAYSAQVDLVIDCGPIPHNPTTVVSLVSGEPELLRQGAGDVAV